MICPKDPNPKYDDYSKCECEYSKLDKDGKWSCGFVKDSLCSKIKSTIGSLQEEIVNISCLTQDDIINGIDGIRKRVESIEDISQTLLQKIENLEEIIAEED